MSISKFERDTRKAAVADRLTQLRKGCKLRQVDVSALTGIHVMTLSGYESGKSEPHLEALSRLASVYEVSLDYLVCGIESIIMEVSDMKFKKDLVFLGIKANEFKDDKGNQQTYYSVSFFDTEAVTPLQVNVMEAPSRSDMIDLLLDSELGQHMTVTFQLRSQEKLYRLQVENVVL